MKSSSKQAKREFLSVAESLFRELYSLVKVEKRFYLEMGSLGIRITAWHDRKAKSVTVVFHRITQNMELIGFSATGNENRVYLAQYWGGSVETCLDNVPLNVILSFIRALCPR